MSNNYTWMFKSKLCLPLKLLFLLMLLIQVIPNILLFHDTVAADIFKLESLLVADVEHVLLRLFPQLQTTRMRRVCMVIGEG